MCATIHVCIIKFIKKSIAKMYSLVTLAHTCTHAPARAHTHTCFPAAVAVASTAFVAAAAAAAHAEPRPQPRPRPTAQQAPQAARWTSGQQRGPQAARWASGQQRGGREVRDFMILLIFLLCDTYAYSLQISKFYDTTRQKNMIHFMILLATYSTFYDTTRRKFMIIFMILFHFSV